MAPKKDITTLTLRQRHVLWQPEQSSNGQGAAPDATTPIPPPQPSPTPAAVPTTPHACDAVDGETFGFGFDGVSGLEARTSDEAERTASCNEVSQVSR